jgi:hypothetical protein
MKLKFWATSNKLTRPPAERTGVARVICSTLRQEPRHAVASYQHVTSKNRQATITTVFGVAYSGRQVSEMSLGKIE